MPTPLSPVLAGPVFAPWSRRVVAALLDGAVIGFASFVAGGPFLTPWGWRVDLGTSSSGTGGDIWWYLLATAAVLTLQAYTGATPGKRLLGIAIVKESDGRPLGLATTVLREIVHVVDWIFLIGYLRPLWHRRRRTFADSICATDAIVTREPLPHPWVERWRASHRRRLSARAVTTAAGAVCTVGLLATVAVGASVHGGVDEHCPEFGGLPVDGSGLADDGTLDPPSGVATAPRLLDAHLVAPGRSSETRLGVTRTRATGGTATLTWTFDGPVTGLIAALGPQQPDGTLTEADRARWIHLHVDPATGDVTIDRGTAVATVIGPGSVEVSFELVDSPATAASWRWSAAVAPSDGANDPGVSDPAALDLAATDPAADDTSSPVPLTQCSVWH